MKKYKVGYTQGVYDMFHVGHLNLLKRAKEKCDTLIVGINADDLVKAYKNKTPVINEIDRCEIVNNIKCVDIAMVVSSLDKEQIREIIYFDALFIGDDWKGTSRWNETEEQMKNIGVALEFFPYTSGVSSTFLKCKKDNAIGE